MAVGPSAVPITPIEAASGVVKNIEAKQNVKKMPNCAAAPKIINLGFVSNGPKSIIAPMPINNISGNNSFAIPALNKVVRAPSATSSPVSLN